MIALTPTSTVVPLALFDMLGGNELLLIFLLVLIFFGGEKMPQFARGLAKAIRELKKAASGVEEEFKRALDEADHPPSARPPASSVPATSAPSILPPKTAALPPVATPGSDTPTPPTPAMPPPSESPERRTDSPDEHHAG